MYFHRLEGGHLIRSRLGKISVILLQLLPSHLSNVRRTRIHVRTSTTLLQRASTGFLLLSRWGWWHVGAVGNGLGRNKRDQVGVETGLVEWGMNRVGVGQWKDSVG